MNLIWAYGQKYIEENDEKLQHMNQDTHNAIIALMGSQILEGIENEEGGEIRMESKALQAIQRRGIKEGDVLRLIVQIQKKIQKHKEVSQIADELEEDVITIEPIYKLIKENPEADKEEIYKMLNS